MQILMKKTTLMLSLCLLSVLFLQTACSDNDPTDDCADVLATLQAVITADKNAVCVGESAELTITGTPNAFVTYTDGSVESSVDLDAFGTATKTVSPSATTEYSLVKIALEDCEKNIFGDFTLTIGGPPVTENIIGSWKVTNANDQSDGKTVTFLADGTGTAPADGAFTMYSSAFNESSTGFTWEQDPVSERMILRFIFPSIPDYPQHYEVDLNDCEEIVLRDVTHVVEPQNKFSLTPL